MKFLYLYPNRPTLVPADTVNPMNPSPDYLNELERSGRWVAEQKWNGDNSLLYTDEMALWNRHHARLAYRPSEELLEELSRFPKGSIVNGEMVNSKTKTVKNFFLAHCVMAWEGKLLTGNTWGDSRKILEDYKGWGEHCVLSPVWRTGFWELFQKADGAVIEGIILKDPNGKLQFSTTPLKDVNYMWKFRKACKKYQF
jgi:ATP-dependent DNA ligase